MIEELTPKFQALIDKAIKTFDGHKPTAYIELLDSLMHNYINIPLEEEDVADIVADNIAWVTKHLRYAMLEEQAKIESQDTAEENPE